MQGLVVLLFDNAQALSSPFANLLLGLKRNLQPSQPPTERVIVSAGFGPLHPILGTDHKIVAATASQPWPFRGLQASNSPAMRKNSLQRFLEKRKDMLITKAPYATTSLANKKPDVSSADSQMCPQQTGFCPIGRANVHRCFSKLQKKTRPMPPIELRTKGFARIGVMWVARVNARSTANTQITSG
eukprot:Gb_19568 [translate_table: standard]